MKARSVINKNNNKKNLMDVNEPGIVRGEQRRQLRGVGGARNTQQRGGFSTDGVLSSARRGGS